MEKPETTFDLVGTLALLASILCWSLMPPMLKSFTPYVDGWTTNGIRYPFAALLWLGPLVYQYRKGSVNPGIWKDALLPTVINIIAQVLWAWIPYFLDASRMGFLARISVVFAVAGGFFFFPDERVLMRRPSFWFGLVLNVLGFVMMSLGQGLYLSRNEWIGTFMILVCGASYGLYGVAARHSMRGSRPWVAFPVISLYTSIVLFFFMLLFGSPGRLFVMPGPAFGFLLLSAVIGIALAHIFFYIAIEHLGVAISSGTQLLGPFLTFLWAFLLFGEKLTLTQWGGGIILLLGGWLLLRTQTRLVPETTDIAKAPVEPKLPD